jgi:hypothetical protein
MNNIKKRLERLQQLFDKGTSLEELVKIYVLEFGFTEGEATDELRRDINALYGKQDDKRTTGRDAGTNGREAYRILSEL